MLQTPDASDRTFFISSHVRPCRSLGTSLRFPRGCTLTVIVQSWLQVSTAMDSSSCRLAEIVQYTCSLERNKKTGKQQVICTQLPRIFKL